MQFAPVWLTFSCSMVGIFSQALASTVRAEETPTITITKIKGLRRIVSE